MRGPFFIHQPVLDVLIQIEREDLPGDGLWRQPAGQIDRMSLFDGLLHDPPPPPPARRKSVADGTGRDVERGGDRASTRQKPTPPRQQVIN